MTKEFITIIDYGSGNLRSAAQACEKAAALQGLDLEVKISDKAEDILGASHLVLPGQGAFGDCMGGLRQSGLVDALEDAVLRKRTPFLGICVGMQLLAAEGHEHGTHQGLGWIGGVVDPIVVDDPALKIPHMGWNEVRCAQSHPILDGISDGEHFYFVHSYHMVLDNPQALLLECTYGRHHITAAVVKDNMVGVQFHPEKSADSGLRLIGNFLRWDV